jgi:hypothetical protein
MKALKHIIVAAVGLATVSCYNMDIVPPSVLGEQVLLNSEDGIRKYLTIAYHDLPIEDFNYYVNRGYTITAASGNRWEGVKNSPSTQAGETIGFNNAQYEDFGYWDFDGINGGGQGKNGPYFRIRELNNFLLQLPNYADNFSEAELLAYEAEVRFLRAYYYFGLVRRYGGVVLMTEVQDPLADPETLMIARSTEYDSWKFIYEDLKFAMENGLEKGSSRFHTGRASRHAAAAFMSRTMLYAGTIAKYGHYVLPQGGPAVAAGLMGMQPDTAKEFFQYAIDGAKAVRDAGFALHTGANKEQAFVDVFLTATGEDIFVKTYGSGFYDGNPTNDVYLVHSWDGLVLPNGQGLSTAPASAINPTWNLVDMYDHPAIQTDEENPRPVRFNTREEFWQSPEMEDRCRATFYFSGMTESASGTVFDFQAGVYTDYPGTVADGTADTHQSTNNYTGIENAGRRKIHDNASAMMNIGGENVRITGSHGTRFGMEQRTNTGIVARKYVSMNSSLRALHQSTVTWKTLRYGEVLLNHAEALYELGLETRNAALHNEAFTLIAELRDRAGAKPYTMKTSPIDVGTLSPDEGGKGYNFSIDENLQFIRDERARELALENHRMYDLIRWRIADKEHPQIGGFKRTYMRSYLVLNENKWIFLPELNYGNGGALTFPIRRYYNQIPSGVVQKNDLIEINDGY